MLKPKLKTVEDFSHYVGKEIEFTDSFKLIESYGGVNVAPGIKYRIEKIKGKNFILKIKSTLEETLPTLRNIAQKIENNQKRNIKELEKNINLWNKKPNLFIVDNSSFWKEGHCINTGYYPQGEKSDCFTTMDYLYTGSETNYYSYQKGTKNFYSRECYERMRLGDLQRIEKYKKNPEQFYKSIKTLEVSMSKLKNAPVKIL